MRMGDGTMTEHTFEVRPDQYVGGIEDVMAHLRSRIGRHRLPDAKPEGRLSPPYPYALHTCDDEKGNGACKACTNLAAIAAPEGRLAPHDEDCEAEDCRCNQPRNRDYFGPEGQEAWDAGIAADRAQVLAIIEEQMPNMTVDARRHMKLLVAALQDGL